MNQQQRKAITIITLVTIISVSILSVSVLAAPSQLPEGISKNIPNNGFIVKQNLGGVMLYREYIPLDSQVYYSVNVYAIETEEAVYLIDAGHELLAKKLYGQVSEDYPKKPIIVLLTHGHADHAGGGSYLQSKGATIYVNEWDWEMVKNGYESEYSPPEFWYTGYEAINYTMPMGYTTLNELIIQATPGHTIGSVSIYYPNVDGWFTGDLFITLGEYESYNDLTSLIVNMTLQSHRDWPILLMMQLNSIMTLNTDVTTLYTGHYGPYQGDFIMNLVFNTKNEIDKLLPPSPF